MNETDKLDTAMRAVSHVLHRVCGEPKVAYLLGHCTESYDLLCRAMAAYNGRTLEDVQLEFTPAPQPGRAPNPTKEEDGMTLLHFQVSETLNVAPFIAAMVIRHARRRKLSLTTFQTYPPDSGCTPDTAQHCFEAERAWQSFCANCR